MESSLPDSGLKALPSIQARSKPRSEQIAPTVHAQRVQGSTEACARDDYGDFVVIRCFTILNIAMPEKRKTPRRKMVLSVKIRIDKGVHLAHTLDITNAGARLGALRIAGRRRGYGIAKQFLGSRPLSLGGWK